MIDKICNWWSNLKLIWKALIILIAVSVLPNLISFIVTVKNGMLYAFIAFMVGTFIYIILIAQSDHNSDSSNDSSYDYSSSYGNSDSYSSKSYSRDDSSKGDAGEITESTFVEAIRKELRNHSVNTVAVYYTSYRAYFPCWVMVNYWGQIEEQLELRYDSAAGREYFVTRSGKTFIVEDRFPSKDEIYLVDLL